MPPINQFSAAFINPNAGKYKKRKEQVEKTLAPIGFKKVVHIQSVLEKKYTTRCLLQATIDAIEQFPDEPFILFEDDIEWCGQTEIPEIPPDADAIYLGFSAAKASYSENKHDGKAIFEAYNKDYARVINMLSGHAILMISEKYKKSVSDTFRDSINDNFLISDIMLARMQNGLRVYAPYGRSIFYQKGIYGGNEHGTHVFLNRKLEIHDISDKLMIWCSNLFHNPNKEINIQFSLIPSGDAVNYWFQENLTSEWIIVSDCQAELHENDIKELMDVSFRKPHNYLTVYKGVYMFHFSNTYKGIGKTWQDVVSQTFPCPNG